MKAKLKPCPFCGKHPIKWYCPGASKQWQIAYDKQHGGDWHCPLHTRVLDKERWNRRTVTPDE